jgi:hypothetical protein
VAGNRLDYAWRALDAAQLAEFCKLLFGMISASTETIIDGIHEYLGFTKFGQHVGMNWQLHCYTCEPDNLSGKNR